MLTHGSPGVGSLKMVTRKKRNVVTSVSYFECKLSFTNLLLRTAIVQRNLEWTDLTVILFKSWKYIQLYYRNCRTVNSFIWFHWIIWTSYFLWILKETCLFSFSLAEGITNVRDQFCSCLAHLYLSMFTAHNTE